MELSIQDRLALTILSHKKIKITPQFDLTYGYKYPDAEDIFSLPSKDTIGKLGQLFDQGYLNRTLYGTILKCPVCKEFRLLLILRCPKCNSMLLEKGSSIRHYGCEYSGFEKEFIRDGKYVCPKCDRTLEKLGVDFRKIGTWYRCLDCGEFFGEPQEKINCFVCDREYIRDDCVLQPIWGYGVNEAKIQDVMLDIELDALISAISDSWDIEMFKSIHGESGIAHPFSLIVSTKGPISKDVVIDIKYSSRPVGQEAVMKFFAKTVDIKVAGSMLIVIPELDELARRLSRSYRIKVLETNGLNKILEKLKQFLSETLEG